MYFAAIFTDSKDFVHLIVHSVPPPSCALVDNIMDAEKVGDGIVGEVFKMIMAWTEPTLNAIRKSTREH
ncbi:hypothetical protein HF325_001373 [Metschnikowia pulcherrima]|uniref:Uncharacterized protein n=1 Tax=Metschnikowia pulcherrima TaxID=27326 RepID=A0A8H7GVM2_9ASCO|nr:hypothetical protein HF325_001373 [Metschnikowia pulcherrima]